MTAEATGGHEAVLDHDKETPSHELLTMTTADADASNGYLRKRHGSGTRIESNGFIVVDGQTRDGDDDGTTTEPEEVRYIMYSSVENPYFFADMGLCFVDKL